MRTKEEVQRDMDAFEGLKTTKPYRKLKTEMKAIEESSMGLGDVVKKAISITGLDKLVAPDCEDCKKRQAKLNAWGEKNMEAIARFFQGAKVREMSREDYDWLTAYLKNGIPNVVTKRDQTRINSIYLSVSGIRKKHSSCAPCVKKVIKALEMYLATYNQNNNK